MPADDGAASVTILFIADIIGRGGLVALERFLPDLMQSVSPDLVVANGENCDEGRGMTIDQIRRLEALGVNVITSGNHIWDKAPLRKEMRNLPLLLRPLNYPPGSGGHGSVVVKTHNDIPVAVVNLQGRTYLPPIDCPFRTADRKLPDLTAQAKVIFVDMHAESTAEKQALAYYLDGRVSAVIGTHTHVQTADERILPGGTGFITDAGMTGAFESVIGMSVKTAIQRFITQTPQPLQMAEGDPRLNGVIVQCDAVTGICRGIKRVNLP